MIISKSVIARFRRLRRRILMRINLHLPCRRDLQGFLTGAQAISREPGASRVNFAPSLLCAFALKTCYLLLDLPRNWA